MDCAVIRRDAKVGDWIAGTGSARFGFQNKLVYAMRVDAIMSYLEYDKFCRRSLPEKIPDWNSKDLRRKVGDCIYDYSNFEPVLRKSVHNGKEIIDRDLRGKNVLLSDHFCYFGSNPIPIKDSLLKIVKHGPGHKSKANDPVVDDFVLWAESLIEKKGVKNQLPFGFDIWVEKDCDIKCSERHLVEDDADENSLEY